MTQLSTGGVTDAREERTTTDRELTDYRETAETADERDQAFVRQIGIVALAWGLLWTGIIAALFLFGDAISAFVV